jgi:hypothetical protein
VQVQTYGIISVNRVFAIGKDRLSVIGLEPASPCGECRAPCCRNAMVMLSAFDVWQLERGLGLAWAQFAECGVAFSDGFRLDHRPTRYGFRLRARPGGACTLLVETPGGFGRCGAHALAPSRCRLYPYHIKLTESYEVHWGDNALCPPSPTAKWRARAGEAIAAVDEEIGEWALGRRVLARWDRAVVEGGGALSASEFVRWTGRLYDQIAPLRRGERAEWQAAAYRLVDAFDLPGAAQ